MRRTTCILLLGPLAIFFWPFLLSHQKLNLGDHFIQALPALDFFWRSVAAGELPLWDPHLQAGMPFAASIINMCFYLPVWICLLFPGSAAFSILLVAHVFWMGFGCYAWARTLGLSRISSLLSAFLLQYSGYTLNHLLGFHGFVFTAAWTPWLLAVLTRLSQGGHFSFIFLGGGMLALQFFAGQPHLFLYSTILTLSFAGFLTLKSQHPSRATLALKYMGLFGFGIALTSVCLLPMLGMSDESGRLEPLEYEVFSKHSLSWGDLAHSLLASTLPGFISRVKYTPEVGAYMGFFPLCLLLYGLLYLRDAQVLFWYGVLCLAGMLCLGNHTPLHSWMHRVPVYNLFASGFRHLFEVTLAISVLSGLILNRLLQAGSRQARERPPRHLPASLGMVLLLNSWMASQELRGSLYYSTSSPEAMRQGDIPPSLRFLKERCATKAYAPRVASWWSSGPLHSQKLRLAALHPNLGQKFGISHLGVYGNASPRRLFSTLFGLNGNGSFTRNSRLPDPASPLLSLLNVEYLLIPKTVGNDPGATSWLQSPTYSLEYRDSRVHIYRRKDSLPRFWLAQELRFYPEQESFAMLQTGWDPLRKTPWNPRKLALIADPERPTSTPTRFKSHPGKASVLFWKGNHIALTLQKDTPSFLVLSEAYDPDWKAAIDGRTVPILKTNLFLRGVFVPPGDHRIDFIYRPSLLYAGCGASLGILLLPLVFYKRLAGTFASKTLMRSAGSAPPSTGQ